MERKKERVSELDKDKQREQGSQKRILVDISYES
mgnify:CR=1 FL=1